MSEIEITLDQLRGLIGIHVEFNFARYEVIEVLEDGPSLVLQASDRHTTIQPNQHGEAHRRVPYTVTIPVLNDDGSGLSAELLSLELVDES